MATTLLITNELRKSLHFCEIQDFRRKIFKYRILRVKNAPSRSPLVDVFSKFQGAGLNSTLLSQLVQFLFACSVQKFAFLPVDIRISGFQVFARFLDAAAAGGGEGDDF